MKTPRFLSREDVIKRLVKKQGRGTRRELANSLGIHETYLGQIFNSEDRELTDRVLSKLAQPGKILRRRIVYEEITPP